MDNISRKDLQKKKKESDKIKSEFSTRLQRKELTFEQFVQFAQQDQYKYLRSFKVSHLLGKMPGWSEILAKRALITMGLNPDITIYRIINNQRAQQQVSHLMSATSNNWQDRRPAPSGFPWNGNILDTFNEIYQDGHTLPPEIERTVRFYLDEEHTDNTKEAQEISDIFDNENEQDEDLVSLLNSDDEDNIEDDIVEDTDIDDDEEDDDGMIYLEDLLGGI